MNRKWGLWAGSLLIAAGLACILYIPFFQLRSRWIGQHLMNQAQQQIRNSTALPALDAAADMPASGRVTGVLGIVDIPSLGLKAPMLEGTDDRTLGVGVGHLSSSVQPGASGTSILAAHNGTWFRNIDQLKAGDRIVIQSAGSTIAFEVTGHQVVHSGSPVYNSTDSTLVLETCYPLNALYLTPYRYLVFADKVQTQRHSATPTAVADQSVHYQAAIPDALRTQDLSIDGNGLPMGTLQTTGTPTKSYTQSNSPFYAVHAASELYLAWLHAVSDKNQSALRALDPKETIPPFWGALLHQIRPSQPFDVTLDVGGDQLLGVQTTTSVSVHGVLYTVRMRMEVSNGDRLRIARIVVSGK